MGDTDAENWVGGLIYTRLKPLGMRIVPRGIDAPY